MRQGLIMLGAMVTLLCLTQCTKDSPSEGNQLTQPNLPSTHFSYTNDMPEGLVVFDNTPEGNEMSDAGVTLGRVLFYDKQLSINNTVACASCHKQELAFSDDKAFSIGFEGAITTRNSPPIMNMRSSRNFFWDFSEQSLENQVITPIANHIEMGMEDMDYLVNKLNDSEYYAPLFKDAFDSPQVTGEGISKAMAQFLRSINSFNSRFDQAKDENNDFASLSDLERIGSQLFIEKGCNSCHGVMGSGAIFDFENSTIIDGFGDYNGTGGDGDLSNIGLDLVSLDQGAGGGQFKIPTLRNLVFTAPYMHDGRFRTIDEVLDHYDHGVKANKNLDFRLRDFTGAPQKLNLTSIEKRAIKDFLLTLTDTDFMQDEKYSDPFRS